MTWRCLVLSTGLVLIRVCAMAKRRERNRGGRPLLNAAAGKRAMIAIRIDPEVLEALRQEADERGIGYQTLINEVLDRYVRRRKSSQ